MARIYLTNRSQQVIQETVDTVRGQLRPMVAPQRRRRQAASTEAVPVTVVTLLLYTGEGNPTPASPCGFNSAILTTGLTIPEPSGIESGDHLTFGHFFGEGTTTTAWKLRSPIYAITAAPSGGQYIFGIPPDEVEDRLDDVYAISNAFFDKIYLEVGAYYTIRASEYEGLGPGTGTSGDTSLYIIDNISCAPIFPDTGTGT
jgi:hypothetical protein